MFDTISTTVSANFGDRLNFGRLPGFHCSRLSNTAKYLLGDASSAWSHYTDYSGT